MGVEGWTCRRVPGSRSGAGRSRSCSPGSKVRATALVTPVPLRAVFMRAGRSQTGSWPSSGCRSRAGGVGLGRRLLAVMLEEVRITGLGVIDDALLELSPGFTALTGETGAGKTMVVTGLGMLFGGKADPARIRPGAQRAMVEGRLRIVPGGKVAKQV